MAPNSSALSTGLLIHRQMANGQARDIKMHRVWGGVHLPLVTLSTDLCLDEMSFVLGSQFLIVDHIP